MRFSVWGMIVLVLVLGAGLGWFGRVIRSAHIRREAAAAIAKIGGTVYAFDRFDNVSNVEFIAPSSTAPDAALADFGHLTHLQVLVLSGSNVSDAGLAHLKGLTKLSELRLNDTPQ